MKLRMLLAAAAALVILAAPALAFHDDGVAHCDGCHTMHNSADGQPVKEDTSGPVGPVGQGYQFLLRWENATDVCLRCHGNDSRSYNVFLTNPMLTDAELPDYYSAGNFVFLLEDNINDGHRGATRPVLGQASGHNLMSGIKGSMWDTVLTKPPSDGSSPLNNNNLHCSSCHDPHGNDGFRMLYQDGQVVNVGGDAVTYQDTIVAYGISYGDVETNDNHNVYVEGYSGWCESCHTGFHGTGTNYIHPAGQALGLDISARYNKYNGTTDCVMNPPAGGLPCGSGNSSTSYLADVPFEDDGFTEADVSSTAGPDANSRVACVSCHRAHATSAENAGRWDFVVTFLWEDGDESGSWEIPNSYDTNQRSLCNKCHTKDEFDHITPIGP